MSGIAKPMDLRVFCLNARYCQGQDGEYRWANRLPRLLSLLDRVQPQVMAFQEVLPHQRADLERELPGYRWLGLGRDHDYGGEQCAVGVHRDLDLMEGGTFWLSPTPTERGSRGWDACLPRICTMLRLRHRGREFSVANVHLDHLGATSRLESVKLIERTFLAPDAILMGDFNCTPESAPVKELLTQFSSSHQRDPHPTFHDFGRSPKGLLIDYIFYRGMLQLEQFEVFVEKAPNFTSDHFPLLADFTFAKPAS